MRRGRWSRQVVTLVLVAAATAGCSPAGKTPQPAPSGSGTGSHLAAPPSSGTPGPTPTPTPTQPRSIVALGDSVPAGNACGCTPYPELTGQQLAAGPDAPVGVTNDAVGGYTSTDVLAQLQTDPAVSDRVRTADVVEIEIGANDVGFSDSCGTSVSCYAPAVPQVEKNLAAIVSLVHQLTAGRHVLVVLLDYWSVWLGGQYAAAQGPAYVAAAAEVTDRINSVIASTASATGSAYVDLRAAFKGPDYADDETAYLAPDGDHPNAEGHEQIAAAAVAVIRSLLHLDHPPKA